MERRGPSETSPGNFFSPFISESDFDSEVVPASLASIAPILCVANDIETRSPRAAFICRFYAFEKSRAMDTTSNGRGVRQFKTALLQRLEREAESTLQGRMEKSDAIEMKNIYKQYYENYVKSLDEAANQAARAHLEKEYQTTAVLFEVLKFVTESESVEVASEVMEAGKNPGAHQVIMQLAEGGGETSNNVDVSQRTLVTTQVIPEENIHKDDAT